VYFNHLAPILAAQGACFEASRYKYEAKRCSMFNWTASTRLIQLPRVRTSTHSLTHCCA